MPMFDSGRGTVLAGALFGTGLGPYTTWQIALLVDGAVADDTSGTLAAKEPGNGYARVTTSAGMWTTAGHGIIENVAPIQFPAPTGSWGSVIQTVIFAGSAPIAYGPVRAEPNPTANTAPLVFLPGALHFEIAQNNLGFAAIDQIVNGLFGGTGYFPSTYYLALSSNLPEPDGGFNEITTPGTNGYQRQPVSSVTLGTIYTGIAYNTTEIDFPVPTGTWGTACAWALLDSGGTMWFYGTLTPSITIPTPPGSGLPPIIGVRQLAISIDAVNSNVG